MPADFAERAATTTTRALAKHYSTGFRVVVRWLEQAGIQPMRGTRYDARPVPEDFATRAATLCTAQLIELYDCAADAIKRWSRLTGVVPPKGGRWSDRPRQPRAVKGPVRPAAYRSFAGPKPTFCNTLRRDDSLEGRAADHLRKWAPVYRCNQRGGVPEDKALLTHWRYGAMVLTAAELIERAERRGFDPGEWERIAA